jgi:hypothetical protein
MALNNALLDASITAWDAKRQRNSVWPITAVRWLKQGQLIQAWGGPYQGTKTIRGEDWLPYQRANLVTPPFPEYISGHSTFSAAAAAVLKAATGSDTFGMTVTIPAGGSTVEPGAVPAAPVTLSWKAFSVAADLPPCPTYRPDQAHHAQGEEGGGEQGDGLVAERPTSRPRRCCWISGAAGLSRPGPPPSSLPLRPDLSALPATLARQARRPAPPSSRGAGRRLQGHGGRPRSAARSPRRPSPAGAWRASG